MTEPQEVLVARGLNVIFHVYEDLNTGIRTRLLNREFRRQKRPIHAIRDVDLVVREGESVGVIGANGSGKSTLLAALCGLVPLASGTVLARSRPTLLGVNAALRPHLSGRSNIMIGGLALGMRRTEVAERIDEMIDFSGLRDFIDMPMRTYSSGMRARLAFTVATAIDPDVLMIDEALAVGDDEFKAKSEQRIADLRAGAGAVMLVSHNTGEIRKSCSRVIWIRHGEIIANGDTDEVLDSYEDRRNRVIAERKRAREEDEDEDSSPQHVPAAGS